MGLVLFWGMGVEFKGKLMFGLLQVSEKQQGFTTGVGFYVYNVLGLSSGMDHGGIVVQCPDLAA